MKMTRIESLKLTDREKAVLAAVVKHYIRTAEPVGSRKLSHEFNLSPATIRNIMADLEDYGFLEQPHVSAGRIPSDEGYRYYVDHMVNRDQGEGLSRKQRLEIQQTLDVKTEVERIMRHVSDLLSRFTRYTGIVVAPKVINTIFKRIQFIRLGEQRILAIFVAKSGLVQNKIIFPDQDYDQDMLDRISTFLNQVESSNSITWQLSCSWRGWLF